MTGRMTYGGVAVALAAALAVSGCGGDAATGGSAPIGAATTTAVEAPEDAKAALVEGATKLQQDTFKSTIDMGASGTMVGVMDPQKKVGEFVMEAESEAPRSRQRCA